MKAVTAAQMRRLEQTAVEAGVSLDELMENAGRAVGDEVAARLGKAAGSRVVVLVGPGNNGGDGLVAATRLAQLGAAVEAFVVAGSGDPAGKRSAAEAAGVRVGTAMDESGIRNMSSAAASADVVIDAVLGTGASRPIGDPLGRALAAVLQSGYAGGRSGFADRHERRHRPIRSKRDSRRFDANAGQPEDRPGHRGK